MTGAARCACAVLVWSLNVLAVRAQEEPPASDEPAADADGDGVVDELEFAGDSDGDGTLDRLDVDDDGDGVYTRFERGEDGDARNSDSDDKPDYLDSDDDGDGVATLAEQPDANGDGDPGDARVTTMPLPNYLNDDDDGDGTLTEQERPGGSDRDSDRDQQPDHLDDDDDGDGVYREPSDVDSDGDGLSDALDPDDDGDGVPTLLERLFDDDLDRDGLIAMFDADDDGDGVPTLQELGDMPLVPRNGDGDSEPDYRDVDDDGDTLPTAEERARAVLDLDGDGLSDSLDADDDGDGIATREERGYSSDPDGDGVPSWLDDDSDGDGRADRDEGTGDADRDGIPDYLDRAAALDGGLDAGDASADGGVSPSRDAASFDGAPPQWASAEEDDGCQLGPRAGGHGLWLLLALFALRRRGLGVLAGALALLGCNDEDPPSYVGLDGGNRPLDGGSDARLDAAADGALDGGDASVRSECIVEGEVLALPIEEQTDRAWSAVSTGMTVHVAYAVATCGGVGAAHGTRIDHLSFESTGPFGAPVTVSSDSDGQCRMRRSPALALSPSGTPELYFSTRVEDAIELYRTTLAPMAPLVQLSEDAAGVADAELFTVATRFGDGPLLAYVNQRAVGAPAQLVTRRPGQPENEIVSFAAGQAPSRLALIAIPEGTSAGLLGWVSERANAFTLRLQPLAPSGAISGAPYELTREVGGGSAIALAATATRAAAVYTVQRGSRAELRFQPLDRAGRPLIAPVDVTGAGVSVSAPSIAPLAQGYVIAHREVVPGSDQPPGLKLTVTSERHVVAERRLGDAAPSGGSSQIIVMNDGRLVVLWSDADASGTMLKIVRARCL